MNTLLAKPTCQVCITQSHEYMIRDSICVAVRDRRTREWLEDHFAIDEPVSIVARSQSPHGIRRDVRQDVHIGVIGVSMVWDLRVFTFGNQVRIGPLERVETASPDIRATMEAQVDQRYRHV